jgi:hypothetical protein
MEMEYMDESIGAIKIQDGLFLGDEFGSSVNLNFQVF